MSAKGVGRISVVEGMMNSQRYISAMEDRLIPQLKEWFPNNECIHMQDKAPCHVSKQSLKFFSDNSIQLLPWPGNSPDLNPIETLWATVKRRLQGKTISTRNEMISAIIQAWCRINL